MAEYIERASALASIRKRCAPCGEGIEALKSVPAADVAPVVRCKDCKWFGASGLCGGWCNEVMARPMPYDGFCSYGERRDGNQ